MNVGCVLAALVKILTSSCEKAKAGCCRGAHLDNRLPTYLTPASAAKQRHLLVIHGFLSRSYLVCSPSSAMEMRPALAPLIGLVVWLFGNGWTVYGQVCDDACQVGASLFEQCSAQ